jgi:ABC-type arginine transport system permease subunit
MEYLCSVSATQQVAGELANTTRTDSNGNIEPKTIHFGGLATAVTYFAKVVSFTYFRGIVSAVSLGQMVVGECHGINADEIVWENLFHSSC